MLVRFAGWLPHPASFLHFRRGAQARIRPVRRHRRLDPPRHRRRSGGRAAACQRSSSRRSRAASRSTAASSRSSPATPSWPRSAFRRRTRTTRSARRARRSRCAQAVDELELEARIGIEAGEVVVDGSESTFATGEAVNLAARLQEAARPGEILVGPTAYRLAAGSLVVEDAGPLELKGIDGPLRAWRVVDMLDGPRSSARSARAARRPRGRARAAREHLQPQPPRQPRAPLHDLRRGRRRQEPARARVPRRRRAGERPHRSCAAVRRGRHLLAARRDGQGCRRASPTTTRSRRRSRSCASAAPRRRSRTSSVSPPA